MLIIPFNYVSVINCLENSASIFGKFLGSFTLPPIILKLYLYPNGHGVVVLVGLMFC